MRLHRGTVIVISWDAVDRQPERREQTAQPLIRRGRAVVRQIAGHDDDVGFPTSTQDRRQQIFERRERVDAANSAAGLGDDVSIGKV
jgi:hypothetical protein